MLARVTATIEIDAPDPSRWRAQLHSLLERTHRALVAHPGMAGITLTESPTAEAVLLLTENLLAILLAGGLDPQDAAWACDIFMMLVTGAAREDDARRIGRSDDDRREQVDKIYKVFVGLPPDQFPLIADHAEQMVAGDSDERLRFAIDVVIDGMSARASRRPPAHRK